MNVKISVFVICVKVIINLLKYNSHDCTFKIINYFKYVTQGDWYQWKNKF